MYEGFLRYAIPISIAMAFVSFLWAWILTAVKPPESSEENPVQGKVDPRWRLLDAGPEGVIKNVTQEIQQKTKAV